MYAMSSFTPDTLRLSNNTISKSLSSSLRRVGTIKLLILAIVVPIMFLTIVNPMWICIFMKYPHVHRYIPTKISDNFHTGNAHVHPQSHTHSKSYKGGVKITKETFDVIVTSKDGRRLEELETTITVIENISSSSENQHHKQDTKQINTATSKVKSNSESIVDRIRKRLFKSRKSCAYFALSIMFLCSVAIYGVAYWSSDDEKVYRPVDDDDNHYVRIDYNDDKSNAVNDENNATENVCITESECTQIQINDNMSTLNSTSPPPYSSNVDNELISISNTSTSLENIQQSTDK